MTERDARSAVLVKSPLSRRYLASLESAVGHSLEIVDVNALQALGAARAIRELHRLTPARLVVPVEDVGAYYSLPILQVLAATTRAASLLVATPDSQLRSFTRVSVLPLLVRFLGSSALNALGALASYVRLGWLRNQTRVGYAEPAVRRLLYINGNLWFGVKAGGSIGHVAGVINSLLRRGFEVHSAACGPAGLLDGSAVQIDLVPQRVFGFPVELNSYRYHHRSLKQLNAYVRRIRPGFIYQRLSLANFVGVELSRRYGLPLVTEYNGSEAWVQQHWGRQLSYHNLAIRAEEVMLRHSHLIVTISDVLREELIGRGVPPERVVMYPNCIDPAVFDPARFSRSDIAATRARHGIPNDSVVATFIGTFGQWHGADVLAHAIRKLLDGEAEFLETGRVRFLLVGVGHKKARVGAILNHPLFCRYVTLTGLVSQREAPSYLAASDILLSPHVKNPDGTRFFGSPTKLFEYMAMGKPIVASDLDQIGEVLAHSVRSSELPTAAPLADESRIAVLCRPGDADDFLRALRFLVKNPAWRSILGVNVRKQALVKYTWDRHVDEILSGMARIAQIEHGSLSMQHRHL